MRTMKLSRSEDLTKKVKMISFWTVSKILHLRKSVFQSEIKSSEEFLGAGGKFQPTFFSSQQKLNFHFSRHSDFLPPFAPNLWSDKSIKLNRFKYFLQYLFATSQY